MMKIMLAARRKREDTQEKYFYEWGIIHVALMITTPAVMRLFKKYVQHYSIFGITNDMLVYPLSEMEWDNMADHWIENTDGVLESVRNQDYVLRMQPHVFGDKAFAIHFAKGDVIFERDGFTPGGVKLIHFLKSNAGMSREAFTDRWRGHAEVIGGIARDTGLIRKYVQNQQLPLDRSVFAGSLFERGDVNAYAGLEEFWFDSLEDMAALRKNPALYAAIQASGQGFIDPVGTFSMVTTERVIYDYTLGDKSSPLPAVLDPDSLEAAIFRQGLRDWNMPQSSGAAR